MKSRKHWKNVAYHARRAEEEAMQTSGLFPSGYKPHYRMKKQQRRNSPSPPHFSPTRDALAAAVTVEQQTSDEFVAGSASAAAADGVRAADSDSDESDELKLL